MTIDVGIATGRRFELDFQGDYREETLEEVRRFAPQTPESRVIARNVRIGHGFHWQREIEMALPGTISLVDQGDGNALLVNTLDIEDYLLGVISSEMAPTAPAEFLKAHAIISRSWALGKTMGARCEEQQPESPLMSWEDHAGHTEFDVCADDHCQRFQGVGRVNDAVREAVEATASLVLADTDGRLADARFHKCCGGRTELFSTCWQDRDYAYLPSKADPWCDVPLEKVNEILQLITNDFDRITTDFHDWEARVDAPAVERKLFEKFGEDVGRIKTFRAEERGLSGRIKKLRVVGSKKEILVGKELVIRRLLSDSCLYSSWFDAEERVGDEIVLHGKGWGHGVGLCQIGAAMMALSGKDCREILDFYYPNSRITHIEKLKSL